MGGEFTKYVVYSNELGDQADREVSLYPCLLSSEQMCHDVGM